MLSRNAKATFFALAGPLMKINGWIYRLARAPTGSVVRVHLGPGQRKYIEGWLNLDANAFTGRCDVWVDLRNRLPFASGTVDAMYSHHVVEHLPDLPLHFREVHRCLKPGGVYRVGGPNGDEAIRRFAAGDAGWFSDYPDARRSIGGRFENFVFCRREHLTILTLSFFEELLSAAGFQDIRPCRPTAETTAPELFQECLAKEEESDVDRPHTLIVEARKPGPA